MNDLPDKVYSFATTDLFSLCLSYQHKNFIIDRVHMAVVRHGNGTEKIPDVRILVLHDIRVRTHCANCAPEMFATGGTRCQDPPPTSLSLNCVEVNRMISTETRTNSWKMRNLHRVCGNSGISRSSEVPLRVCRSAV